MFEHLDLGAVDSESSFMCCLCEMVVAVIVIVVVAEVGLAVVVAVVVAVVIVRGLGIMRAGHW